MILLLFIKALLKSIILFSNIQTTLIVSFDQRKSPNEVEWGRSEGESAGEERRLQVVQPIRSGHGGPRPIRYRATTAGMIDGFFCECRYFYGFILYTGFIIL